MLPFLIYSYALSCVLLPFSLFFAQAVFSPNMEISFSEMQSHHRAFIQHHKLFICCNCVSFGDLYVYILE